MKESDHFSFGFSKERCLQGKQSCCVLSCVLWEAVELDLFWSYYAFSDLVAEKPSGPLLGLIVMSH
jgi:hypothetical protein